MATSRQPQERASRKPNSMQMANVRSFMIPCPESEQMEICFCQVNAEKVVYFTKLCYSKRPRVGSVLQNWRQTRQRTLTYFVRGINHFTADLLFVCFGSSRIVILDLSKDLFWFNPVQQSKPYSDTSPYEVSEYILNQCYQVEYRSLCHKHISEFGQEPWSSGYGKRLMF